MELKLTTPLSWLTLEELAGALKIIQSKISGTTDIRPLFTLTVSEFQNLLTATLPKVKTDLTPATTERKRIYGIRGLADYLAVSVPTAQRLKNSKKFPFYESGNKVFLYSDEVDAGLKVAALEKEERRHLKLAVK